MLRLAKRRRLGLRYDEQSEKTSIHFVFLAFHLSGFLAGPPLLLRRPL